MTVHKLYELKDKLMNELEDYSENGKFSKDDAENIKALSASIEHICNICESDGEGGYSGRMYPDGMGGNRGSYMWNGGSYARGRRRDSMGRYSNNGGYSRDGDLVDQLHELMQDAPDDRTRQEFQRFIEKIERM